MYETIEYCGVLLTCEYEYTPEQLETFTDPGYPEELNVTKVIHRNDDITDLLDSQLEEISDEVLKILKVGDPS